MKQVIACEAPSKFFICFKTVRALSTRHNKYLYSSRIVSEMVIKI